MYSATYMLRPAQPSDAADIEALHEMAFGPGRFARTAFRLREGVAPDRDLSLVAQFGDRVGGSVTMTRIRIGHEPALVLGPLAVHPDFARKGAGRALVRASLNAARIAGHRLVLLVGDEPYYGPLGFRRVDYAKVMLPGPVDPRRVLLAELQPGAFDAAEGMARNWHW
ncbi:MAG: N-acetyltransferase [Ancalomicrobiaceae bacterium]|nr:N-acetyltransferase [Ancalomicrobiaceae bacterium]